MDAWATYKHKNTPIRLTKPTRHRAARLFSNAALPRSLQRTSHVTPILWSRWVPKVTTSATEACPRMTSRPRRRVVARSTAIRSTKSGAGAASAVSPASAVDNAADITSARESLSRFRCDRRVHSGDCVRDVAVASRARVRDAIVDVRSQMPGGATMLAQTVATTTRKKWFFKKSMMPVRRRKAPEAKSSPARALARSGRAPRVLNTLIIMSYSPSSV